MIREIPLETRPSLREDTMVIRRVILALAVLVGAFSPMMVQAQALPSAQESGAGEAPVDRELPCPFPPLDAQHEAYVRQCLQYWESSTSQIQRFRCKFNRWEYDPIFGPPAHPQTGEMQAAAICSGEIKFEMPDKAMFDVVGKWTYRAGEEGKPGEYADAGEAQLERWISDGRFTYEFDFAGKQLKKHELPPEMQGKTIADGPIPFIFGAKADRMLQRYWIRVITPDDAAKRGEYWLEAYPRFASDAADFSRVRVILDGEEFLPQAIEIFAADYDEIRNRKSATYTFEERRKNESDRTLFFIQRAPFYEPSIPSGWQLVEMPLNRTPAVGPTTTSPGATVGPPRVGQSTDGVDR